MQPIVEAAVSPIRGIVSVEDAARIIPSKTQQQRFCYRASTDKDDRGGGDFGYFCHRSNRSNIIVDVVTAGGNAGVALRCVECRKSV